MSDLLKQHARGVEEFSSRVHAIKPDQWSNPTPCAEWDVRTLVNHLVYEQVWVAPLIEGKTIAEIGDVYEGDLLGDDPVAAWDAASAQASAALSGPGALERIVHLSFGDIPAADYAWQLIGDLAIHSWDLSRGISADDAIDPELAAEVITHLEPEVEMLAGAGVFAARVPVADDADVQTRLLGLSGRRR